jgi:transglutaminase-like putative cysteine protease
VDEYGIPHGLRADAPPFRIPDWVPHALRLDLLTELVETGLDDPELQACAWALYGRALARTQEIDPTALLANPDLLGQTIIEYVQSGGYRPDPPGEWYQGPAWTLHYAGNCNDSSVLFACLARIVGLEAEIWWIDQREYKAPRDHVTVRVTMPSGRVCWAETTLDGAAFCENPYRAAARLRPHAAPHGL